jgi:hypothetical protein
MDAFLNERSITFMRNFMEMRNRENVISHLTNTIPGLLVRINTVELMEKEAIELKRTLFKQKLYKSLKAGENIVLFSGSKKFINEEVKPLMEDLGLVEEEDALFYTADTSDELKNEVENIDKKWTRNNFERNNGKKEVKDVKLLCFSPCITVGISYDIPDHYDSIFCYALPSCLVRDYFQALYRVRETRKRKLYYTIQSFYKDRKVITKEALEARFKQDTIENKKNYNQVIKDLGIENDFEKAPKWLMDLHISNMSEKNISDSHFRTMFDYYLHLNNYIKKEENDIDEELDLKKSNCCLEWEELDDIDDEKKEELEKKVKKGRATEIDKLQLRKYFVNNSLNNAAENHKYKFWDGLGNLDDKEKDEIKEKIENNTASEIEKLHFRKSFIDNSFSISDADFYSKWYEIDNIENEKREEIEKKITNNSATEQEKLELKKFYINNISNPNITDYKNQIWLTIQQTENKNKFYRFLYEVNNNTDELIRNELKQKTYGAFVNNLFTSFQSIKDLMNIIGLKHSCDNQTLIDQEVLTNNAEKIKALTDTIKEGLGIVDRRKKIKTKNSKLQTELKNLLNDVFFTWSGSCLKSKSTRRRENGTRKYTYTYFLQPMEGLEGLTNIQDVGNMNNILNCYATD